MNYHQQNNVDTKIIRIFNTYGPNMHPHDGRVVSNFIVQALQNQDITIYGEGNQTRSFQYVDDLVEGMIRLMNSRDGFRGPVNVGNPNEFTILELAQKVIDLTGSKSKLIYKPLPSDDPMQRQPDITLAKKVLNWDASTPMLEGIGRTIEYFRKLENELEKAIAEVVIVRNKNGTYPLLPSQHTIQMMAKAAAAVYETAVENDKPESHAK